MRFGSEDSRYSRYARVSRAQSRRIIIYVVILVGVIVAMIALRARRWLGTQRPQAGPIEWLLTFDEALAQAKAKGKPIMAYFFVEGDEACARMNKVTFADPAVRAEAADFICVRLNGQAEPELAERYYAAGYPTVAFVTPEGDLLRAVLNDRDPAEFVEEMREALQTRRAIPVGLVTAPGDDEPLAQSPELAPKNAEPSRGEAD